jgi:hypothetical protein
MANSKSTAPWMPVPYSDKEIRLVWALASGEATKEQQQEALRFIIEVVSGSNDMPFRAGSFDETAFACGRMYVGKTLVKLLTILPKNANNPFKE